MTRFSKGLRTLLVGGFIGALAVPAGAQLTSFIPAPGNIGLTYLGNDLIFQGIDKNAANRDILYLMANPNTYPQTGPILAPPNALLGDNFSSSPSCLINQFCLLNWNTTLTAAQLAAMGLTPGSELVFGLWDTDLNNVNYSGDPNRNGPPPFYAALTSCNPPTTGPADQSSFCLAAMEDLPQRGDGDVNDIRFSVTATPEPASLSLLLTGMLGLGGAGFSRRKNKNI